MSVSPSLEDYLETILSLQKRNQTVRVTDIATEMSISKPSVNKAIKNLKQHELVLHEHYGDITLTEKGAEIAQSVTFRHMVVKKFLCELLQVEENIAEAEACKIEHSISASTLQKLSEYLDKVIKAGE